MRKDDQSAPRIVEVGNASGKNSNGKCFWRCAKLSLDVTSGTRPEMTSVGSRIQEVARQASGAIAHHDELTFLHVGCMLIRIMFAQTGLIVDFSI